MRADLLLAAFAIVAWNCPLAAQETKTPYHPKNGTFSLQEFVLGGGFRVTAAIPLHGDFSGYGRLEIVRPVSAIGPDAPAPLLQRIGEQLAREFRKIGRFSDVALVEGYVPRPEEATLPDADVDVADPLDAPMRPAVDLVANDQRREAARARRLETLVIATEVIDYAPGNKLTQLLLLDLGNSILTLRLSLFDKATGVELGRSIVSSDNSSKVVPSLLSPRSPLTGVAEGLADQVTRKQVGAER